MQESESSSNPLTRLGGDPTALPAFDEIAPEHVEPALRELLAELGAEVEQLEQGATSSWEDLVDPLEAIGDRLGRVWGTVQHLMGVRNGDPLREAHEAVQPAVVELSLRLAQSRPLYDRLLELQGDPGFATLGEAQKRVIESMVRDARHTGVGLEGPARERFNEIAREQAELATRFSNHVLDATRAWSMTLHEEAEVAGLPASWRALAASAARDQGEDGADAESGPWRLTLDAPSFVPFMEHSRRRDLRESLYRAYVARAGSGEEDNAPLIEQILALRKESASLLGYASYAELSLSAKMAPNVDAASGLLEALRQSSFAPAKHDLAELERFAAEAGAPEAGELALWDIAFWAQRLREDRFSYSEEDLRPYFPLPVVLEGLFALAQRLFAVTIEVADGEAPVWHEDVRFFRVRDGQGQPLASFYLDPYSRPSDKRGGAWMDECLGRSQLLAPTGDSVRRPVAYLVCNQAPPVDGKPSLMSFREVETLFHEFGHGLQHMLTQVDCGLASGIRNIEWDAVELPSQFMENWCYQRETLREISRHVETGESLPDELFEKIRAARTFRAGSDMLRQLYFGILDLELHHKYEPGTRGGVFGLQQEIAKHTTVLPPLTEDRFLCSFGHIFAGGYAAGYYSYKWAEVLSADAFGAFEEAGLADPASVEETGHRFRDTVLALGGSRPPMEVFRAFRGREPSPDALLRHAGLVA